MTSRHRLNRGGHRQANAALYRTVIVRMQYHEPTKTYVARRTAEGKTKTEIIRCLKRFLHCSYGAAAERVQVPAGSEPEIRQHPIDPLDAERQLRTATDPGVGTDLIFAPVAGRLIPPRAASCAAQDQPNTVAA